MISRSVFILAFSLLILPELILHAQVELGFVRNAQLVLIENVELASRDGGIVVEILVQPGQPVKKGENMVVLDFEFNEAEVAVAKNDLSIAEKNRDNNTDLEFAEKSVAVSDKVVQRSSEAIAKYAKVMSKTEFERLGLEHEQATLTKLQAEHALELNLLTANLKTEQLVMAKLNLRNRRIESPLDGLVMEVQPQVGEWVAPGQKIARIISLDRLRVEAIVPANLSGILEVGQAAVFIGKVGDHEVRSDATLTFVSPEIDPVNQDFKVWAEIDNSERLLQPGLVGEVHFYQ